MPATTSRLLGSGHSIIYFGDIPITWARYYTETPPKLVAEPSVIQPLDFERPAEIMTPKAMGEGTIELDLIESWSEQAWNRFGNSLAPLAGKANNSRACETILDIVRAVDRSDQGIYIAKLIATPDNTSERFTTRNRRSVLYLGAKIVDVQDGDRDVEVSTMEQSIRITFMYTHRKYNYNPVGGGGYRPRDPAFPRFRNGASEAPNLNRPL